MTDQIIKLDRKQKLPELNYLKGFSILTIVLFHAFNNYMTAMPNAVVRMSAIGGTGVHVFIFCSGLGLYLSYLRNPVSGVEFMKKRFIRVYLPYIFVVCILFFIPWMYDGEDRLLALSSHVFLFKMFVPRFEESFGGQLWFVSTIIQIYLIFIPICKLKKMINKDSIFLAIMLGISVCWWILVLLLGKSDERIWNSFCLQYIWEIALGMCVAECMYKDKEIKLNKLLLGIIAIFGIAIQAIMAMSSPVLKVFNDIPALFGYGALALLLSNISIVRVICSKIEGFSYELYLIHMAVMTTVFYLVKPQGMLLQCIMVMLAIGISLVLAYIYNKLIARVRRMTNRTMG